MGDRSVDCRVFHTIPAFLGAFLALSTGIAGQQDSAAKEDGRPCSTSWWEPCGWTTKLARWCAWKRT